MMRLRRASVIAALSLLASAATASAECAWVLWEDTMQSPPDIIREPVRAYITKQDCDRALGDVLADFKSSSIQTVNKDMKRQEAYVTKGKTTIFYRYVCLPDTVDPRGAKGK
jgi:hypothetical protein